MVKHTIFTVVVPIQDGKQNGLREALVNLNYARGFSQEDVFGFRDVEMLHFASMFIYNDPKDGWLLVFESNIDGEIEVYLERLFEVAQQRDQGQLFLSLFQNCQDFSGSTLDDLKQFLKSYIHRPEAAYITAVELTRDQILQDAAIYRVIDETLGAGETAAFPDVIQQTILEKLANHPETSKFWPLSPDSSWTKIKKFLRKALVQIVGILALVVSGILFLIMAAINLIRERTAIQDQQRPDLDHIRAQKEYEDHLPTNHMVSVVHLHTDLGRSLGKKLAFALLKILVAIKYNKGWLGPINTIHFAHWAKVNDGRRLIFVSNYGGSWKSYLDDFTLKAQKGLTLAWAHGIGFPKSWIMIFEGAGQGPEFIDWARRSMVPTLVWYKAYPGVSAPNIHRNHKIRDALIDAQAGKGDTSWLNWV